jgi:hypothetical protein
MQTTAGQKLAEHTPIVHFGVRKIRLSASAKTNWLSASMLQRPDCPLRYSKKYQGQNNRPVSETLNQRHKDMSSWKHQPQVHSAVKQPNQTNHVQYYSVVEFCTAQLSSRGHASVLLLSLLCLSLRQAPRSDNNRQKTNSSQSTKYYPSVPDHK